MANREKQPMIMEKSSNTEMQIKTIKYNILNQIKKPKPLKICNIGNRVEKSVFSSKKAGLCSYLC